PAARPAAPAPKTSPARRKSRRLSWLMPISSVIGCPSVFSLSWARQLPRPLFELEFGRGQGQEPARVVVGSRVEKPSGLRSDHTVGVVGRVGARRKRLELAEDRGDEVDARDDAVR